MTIGLETFLTTLLNGLTNGLLLFLIAVGLTLIFGVLGVLNFAHGSLYMLGAYLVYVIMTPDGLVGTFGNYWVGVVLAIVGVALIGGILERTIIRPAYEKDHIFQLLLTFAIVLILDNAARIIWGTNFRSVSRPEILAFQADLGIIHYPAYNLFLIVLAAIMAAVMWLIFKYTLVGKTIRAAAEDRETASALGINVPRVFTLTFIVGSGLAGLGGALAAPLRAIQPGMGENIIIESFIVVIIGGIGSFAGALVGALLLGLAGSFVFLAAPWLQAVVPFILLAVVILLRPEGLFGEGIE